MKVTHRGFNRVNGQNWLKYVGPHLPIGTRPLDAGRRLVGTFDFFDPVTGFAATTRTLEPTGEAYGPGHPQRLHQVLLAQIGLLADCTGFTRHGYSIRPQQITAVDFHLAVPAATTPAQWTQIRRAVAHADALSQTLSFPIKLTVTTVSDD